MISITGPKIYRGGPKIRIRGPNISVTELDALFAALQHRAFRGEL